jgi:poly-gamma-glutamate capsule biosynthesis protein CapA/YwtB (metallophosphatase superfamily)
VQGPRTFAIVMTAALAGLFVLGATDDDRTNTQVAGTAVERTDANQSAAGASDSNVSAGALGSGPAEATDPASGVTSSAASTTLPGEPITIALAGDVHGEPPISGVMNRGGSPLEFFGPELSAADVAVVNLETTIGVAGKAQVKKYVFRSDDRLLASLTGAGVDVVSLANNHSYDYGRAGFTKTLERVRAMGLLAAGGGMNAAEAYAPAIVDVRGTKVAIVGIAKIGPSPEGRASADRPGTTNGRDQVATLQAIRDANAQADIVVVFNHWGIELDRCPLPEDKALAQAMLDAGADAVVGAHPHVLQGISTPPGKLIAYSLGNFVFYAKRPAARDTMVLTITFATDGTVTGHKVATGRIDTEGRPRPVAGTEGQRIVNDIVRITPDGPGPC